MRTQETQVAERGALAGTVSDNAALTPGIAAAAGLQMEFYIALVLGVGPGVIDLAILAG